MQLASNRNKKMNHIVWLTVFLLAILVFSTVSVVTSCMYGYAHQSDCQISLFKGSSNSKVDISKSKSVLAVNDSRQVWKTKTPIELFRASYVNDRGVVSVKSVDGNKIVAPGTEGSYTFSLKNSGSSLANYKVWVKSELNPELMNAPVLVRMSDGRDWLLGDESAWEDVSSLNGVSTEKNIGAGKSVEYTIYWKWPFESNRDLRDTTMGNVSSNQDLSCTVMIYTLTESSSDGSTSSLDWINTAVSSHTWLWVCIMVVSGGLLILIFKRRKNDKDEAK